MSQLNVNTITTLSGTDITIPTGKKLVVTDSGGLSVPGTVVQVVSQPWTGQQIVTSSSYVAVTNSSVVITPKFSTSKVLIMCHLNLYWPNNNEIACVVYRGGSAVVPNDGLADCYNGVSDGITTASLTYLDSPATTSATAYQVYIKRTQGSGTTYTNLRSTTSVITVMEIAQ